jgi:hypothetical protein
LHLYGITTVLAGTTGTITSDHYTNEAPWFWVLPDDQVVRNDLAEWGGQVEMMRGWEEYLELIEPSAVPPGLTEEAREFPATSEF